MIRLFSLAAMLSLNSCCLSPYWRGCGMDDSERMSNQMPSDLDVNATPEPFIAAALSPRLANFRGFGR